MSRSPLPAKDPEVAELRGELAAWARRIEALEQRNGARDAAEAACLLAIASTIGSRAFTSRQLLEHAAQNETLGAALLEADIETVRECGKLMARLSWQPIDGYYLVREGASRDGLRWRVSAG